MSPRGFGFVEGKRIGPSANSPDRQAILRVAPAGSADALEVVCTIAEAFGNDPTWSWEVLGADGKMISEVKGAINEVEVAGGGTVEWFMVPVQTGKDIPMECAIEGHKEAGMVGTVTIN